MATSKSNSKRSSSSSEKITIPPISKQTAGAATGAIIGSVAGPVGAVVGGVLGSDGSESGGTLQRQVFHIHIHDRLRLHWGKARLIEVVEIHRHEVWEREENRDGEQGVQLCKVERRKESLGRKEELRRQERQRETKRREEGIERQEERREKDRSARPAVGFAREARRRGPGLGRVGFEPTKA